MFQWLMGKFYDRIMHDAEQKCLGEWRQSLFQNISGDVLELGCGTGVNLQFYPNDIKRLVLIEPSAHMRQQLDAKIAPYKHFNIKVLHDKAEHLSLADSSFDTVICTLVLCSVENMEKALSEIHRVLRPHGKLIFIEHVAAINNLKRYRWQRRLAFLWKTIFAGCHITRHTDKAILEAGFKMLEFDRQSMRGVPPVARPSIRGIAVKV